MAIIQLTWSDQQKLWGRILSLVKCYIPHIINVISVFHCDIYKVPPSLVLKMFIFLFFPMLCEFSLLRYRCPNAPMNTLQIKIYIYIHVETEQNQYIPHLWNSLEWERWFGMASWSWWKRGLKRWQSTDSSLVCLWLPSSLLCTRSCSHLSLCQSFSQTTLAGTSPLLYLSNPGQNIFIEIIVY